MSRTRNALGSTAMLTPKVIEIRRPLHRVTVDTFIAAPALPPVKAAAGR